LLAAGNQSVELIVPVDATQLTVNIVVDDGLGNQRNEQRVIRVINPWSLQISADTLVFDHALAGVGQAWYAQGAQIVNSQAQLLAQLSGRITAMAHFDAYILLAVDGYGIQIIDPQQNYNVIAQLPVLDEIKNVFVNQHSVIIMFDDHLDHYNRLGTVFEFDRNAFTSWSIN